ncbi:MAG: amidohydrolase [Firmicutes bacterium HGW-Firmicutes-7]|nr:MAG: amidohydrolase [Firmicutes bacterium HGW-Firmicutes-7]
MKKADILLKSTNVFTATNSKPIDGYVAITNNIIIAVDAGDGTKHTNESTTIYNLVDKVVCPGFSDVHCFFTGYVLGLVGVDLSSQKKISDVFSTVKKYNTTLTESDPILAHGISPSITPPSLEAMDDAFGSSATILFCENLETCWMNSAAINLYNFTPATCYPEAYWRLLKVVLSNKSYIVPQFKEYIKMLNRRGVTSIKEMGFDDFYGFTDFLEELEKDNALNMRVHFMSQPVGEPANLAYGLTMQKRFQGDFVRFSGYNQMTDGSISQLAGDLKSPYKCAPRCYCSTSIDYDTIEQDVLALDAKGFRYSLHAQGDAAIYKVLNILEKCKRNTNGKLVNRHSITDLEFSDPQDLERMGDLGVIAEIYPQIMSIADRKSKLAMIEEKIGIDRGRYYWNRRKMVDSGVLISCGTDLPLLIDDIPESIYCACGAFFPEGGEPFNPENTLTITELLTAWTHNGQYNLGREKELGTLTEGKLADIAVLDMNIFKMPIEDIRDVKVCLTLINGKVVHSTL